MRFWDSSAVVPLCVAEPHSASARSLLEGDLAVAAWWATRTECLSALTRRMREGELSPAGYRAARRVLAALAETWVVRPWSAPAHASLALPLLVVALAPTHPVRSIPHILRTLDPHTGLLEHRIETTAAVVSILIG